MGTSRLQLLYEEMVRQGIVSSKKEFASMLNIRYENLSRYLSGQLKTSIGAENYRNFSDTGVNIEWLLTGKGEMFNTSKTESTPDIPARIPLLRQSVSCGPGQNWDETDAIEGYIELLALVPEIKSKNIYAFRVRGTSMVGAGINDGDVVLLDASYNTGGQDDLYVFALEGSIFCKLLKFDAITRKIQIYSLHRSEMEKAELLRELDASDPALVETFHIFGRVLAWIRENRLMWR